MILPPIKGILFDFDGTLYNTLPLIFRSMNEAWRPWQNALSDQEIMAMFGPPDRAIIREVVGVAHADEAYQRYLDFYRLHHREIVSDEPLWKVILPKLREEGIALAVYTGKGRDTAQISLEAGGILPWLDLWLTGDDVKRHKPDPEGLHLALERLQLQPEELIVIGDAGMDLEMARAAGCRFGLVRWFQPTDGEILASKADWVFETREAFGTWAMSLKDEGGE